MTSSQLSERRIAAGHEAGHAVLAWHFGIPVEKIVMNVGNGATWTEDPDDSPCECALVALGGLAADVMMSGLDLKQSRSSEDVDHALTLVPESELLSLIQDACSILAGHADEWLRLAERLLTADELDAAEVAGMPAGTSEY
jgi:hypothetical protein